MFMPKTGSNQPFLQLVNREVFFHGSNHLCMQPVPVGSVGQNDYCILTEKLAN